MFERWIISMVISFVLKQLDKFVHAVDWTKVRADALARVAKFVPAFFKQEAEQIVNFVIDGVVAVLSAQADLQAVLDLLAASKWQEAGDALIALLKKIWLPQVAGHKYAAVVEKCLDNVCAA